MASQDGVRLGFANMQECYPQTWRIFIYPVTQTKQTRAVSIQIESRNLLLPRKCVAKEWMDQDGAQND
jgi:hypothetical protein